MSQGVPTPIPDCLPHDHGGRPTLCTDAVIAAAEAQLRKSGYPSVVLESLGMSGVNHTTWLQHAVRDEENGLSEQESPFIRYSKAVKRAVAARELSLASLVADAAASGPQYWPAGMTYLERRHPERWGRREREPGLTSGPIQIQVVFAAAPAVLGVGRELPSLTAAVIDLPAIGPPAPQQPPETP